MGESNKYWQLYQLGLDYINREGLIRNTQINYNMYIGKQWEGLRVSEQPPMHNFIKPIGKHKISTIAQSNMVAKFSDAEGRDELKGLYEKLNAKFMSQWERSNMDLELWETTKEAYITGDGFQYYGTADVADMQRLPATEILLGDNSEQNIQEQPYIIIRERKAVRDIRAIAEENGLSGEEISLIVPDSDTQDLVGNKNELEYPDTSDMAKTTSIIYMEKIDGVVHLARSTQNVVYEPLHPVARTRTKDGSVAHGMKLYPIVKFPWEDMPNCARGVSEVEQIIPNQLEVNKTLARISIVNKMFAYPKLGYVEDLIENPEALNEVGTAIAIRGGGMQSVDQAIQYLNPAQMTSEPRNHMDALISMTQELNGSGETAMGNINPTRVAASAIIAIRDQAALPLNEQLAKKRKFIEDLAKVWIEIWLTYHPDGFEVVIEEEDVETGIQSTRTEKITKEELEKIEPEIRIDVSQDNPWTKEAEQNALDALLDKQLIDINEYAAMCPVNGPLPVNELKAQLRRRAARQQEMAQQQAAMQEAEDYSAIQQQAQQMWEEQDAEM